MAPTAQLSMARASACISSACSGYSVAQYSMRACTVAACMCAPLQALVGPYTYIKVTCKLDVWWDSEGHVSAKEYVHYEYPLTGRNPGVCVYVCVHCSMHGSAPCHMMPRHMQLQCNCLDACEFRKPRI